MQEKNDAEIAQRAREQLILSRSTAGVLDDMRARYGEDIFDCDPRLESAEKTARRVLSVFETVVGE